jgi:hypothetical protein
MAAKKRTSRGGAGRGKFKKGITKRGQTHRQRGKNAHMRKKK